MKPSFDLTLSDIGGELLHQNVIVKSRSEKEDLQKSRLEVTQLKKWTKCM